MCGSTADAASARDRLLDMYDSRGATEHLALPVRDLTARDPSLTSADAEVPFAALVFMGEGLARHALLRVLTTPRLRQSFATEDAMLRFWAQDDAAIQAEWGDPFPLAEYSQRFDAERARDQLRRGRADREHYRSVLRQAPPEFRSGETY